MDNEEALFEIWWALYRKDRWQKTRPDMGPHPSPTYLSGFKEHALLGWKARAGTHVTWNRDSEGKSGG